MPDLVVKRLFISTPPPQKMVGCGEWHLEICKCHGTYVGQAGLKFATHMKEH